MNEVLIVVTYHGRIVHSIHISSEADEIWKLVQLFEMTYQGCIIDYYMRPARERVTLEEVQMRIE